MRPWRGWLAGGLVGTLLAVGSPSVWAASDSTNVTHRYTFFHNSKGLNDKADPVAIDDEQAADLQNVLFNTDGAIVKRKGFTKFNSRTVTNNPAFTSLYYYRRSNGNSWLVGTTSNAKVQTSTNVVGLFQDITGNATWVSSANVLQTFDTANDLFLMADGSGTNPPWKWDPTDTIRVVIALGGSPPPCTMLKFHKNHLFVAGDSANPSLLSFSNIGAVELWDARDAITVQTNDGSPITALWEQLDGLYIGKRTAIFRLDGSDRSTFTLQKMVEGIGPINQQSVQVIANVAYFLTPIGHVYRYDGGVTLDRLSDRIQTTVGNLNLSRLPQAVSGKRDREYWLAVSPNGQSTNTQVLMYDPITDSWTRFKGIQANAMAWAYDPTGALQFYTGAYNGYTYLQRSGNSDDGVAINAYWASKQHRFPDITTQKILRRVKVTTDALGSWNLTLEVRSDFEGAGTVRSISLSPGNKAWGTLVWGTDVWGGIATTISDQPVDKIKEYFQVRFSNANAGEPFTVHGYTVDVDPTGRP